jgi:hypothetical protein
MALRPHRLEFKLHRFEFIFAMVLAMTMTILAITTWAALLESGQRFGCADPADLPA